MKDRPQTVWMKTKIVQKVVPPENVQNTLAELKLTAAELHKDLNSSVTRNRNRLITPRNIGTYTTNNFYEPTMSVA